MHAQFIEHKTALATKWALAVAIRLTGARPYSIWSDNGTEFKGEFDDYLARERITHVRTDPYNPEQNGKMERWWPSLEKRPAGVGLLVWVDRYNDHRHKGLPRDQTVREANVHMSPNQAYDLGPMWRPGIPGTWRVNGTVCPFPPGRRLSGTRQTRPLPRHRVAKGKRTKRTGTICGF
jgi:transposase InsO family protein